MLAFTPSFQQHFSFLYVIILWCIADISRFGYNGKSRKIWIKSEMKQKKDFKRSKKHLYLSLNFLSFDPDLGRLHQLKLRKVYYTQTKFYLCYDKYTILTQSMKQFFRNQFIINLRVIQKQYSSQSILGLKKYKWKDHFLLKQRHYKLVCDDYVARLKTSGLHSSSSRYKDLRCFHSLPKIENPTPTLSIELFPRMSI